MLWDFERQRLDVYLVRHLREDTALLDPDGLAVKRDHDRRLDHLVEADFLEVDMRDVAANLVALVLLEDRRVLAAAVDRDVEHGMAAGLGRQRCAEITLADRDRNRPVATVENPGNQPLPAQAARLGRAEL